MNAALRGVMIPEMDEGLSIGLMVELNKSLIILPLNCLEAITNSQRIILANHYLAYLLT
jgi:hypothetical protein